MVLFIWSLLTSCVKWVTSAYFCINAVFKTRNPAASSAIAHIHSLWLGIINLSKSMRRRKKNLIALLQQAQVMHCVQMFACNFIKKFNKKNISISVYIFNSTTYKTKENENFICTTFFFFHFNLISQNLCPTVQPRTLLLLSKLFHFSAGLCCLTISQMVIHSEWTKWSPNGQSHRL